MCLLINPTKHSRTIKTGKYIPKISIFPIRVYKILCKKGHGSDSSWYSPCRDFPIEFHDNKCVMESDMMSSYASDPFVYQVFQGIHAYTVSDIAIHTSKLWEASSLNTVNYCVFKAVIPPFTKYFIGVHNEIVSEKLIIKNKKV